MSARFRHFELPISFLVLAVTAAGTAASVGATPPTSIPVLEAPSLEPDAATNRQVLRRIDTRLRRADVRDAKRQVFKQRPWARADVRSLARLDEALTAPGTAETRRRIETFLERAARDGEASFLIELDRLSLEERASMARELGCPPAGRECIADLYRQHAATALAAALDEVRRVEGRAALERWVEDLRRDLAPSIKTRGRNLRKVATFPAFLPAWAWRKSHSAHEYEGPQWIDFADYRLYAPRPEGSAVHDELLARFAPIVVQEVVAAEEHDPEIDRIGTFEFVAGKKHLLPVVDTGHPMSYAYRDVLRLRGEEFQQLVYTFWYPEHARSRGFLDFEAGQIEGITLRITLDRAGQPRLYETIYNCGCSHRLFVDRELESAAAAELGAPQKDRSYSIQRHVKGKIDWVVPELVDRIPGRRPMLFVRAGFHLPASVRYALPDTLAARPAGEQAGYDLAAYEELEHLPHGEDWVSIFNRKGLVRGASRLEGIALSPLGLLRAGQPRQRGTQLIHFDQADFDDPEIYETYLRLPSIFFTGEEGEARASTGFRRGGREGSTP